MERSYENRRSGGGKMSDQLLQEWRILREAVENIASPITYLNKCAEKEGNKLDGHRVMEIVNDVAFYREIAEQALKKTSELTVPRADDAHRIFSEETTGDCFDCGKPFDRCECEPNFQGVTK